MAVVSAQLTQGLLLPPWHLCCSLHFRKPNGMSSLASLMKAVLHPSPPSHPLLPPNPRFSDLENNYTWVT